MFIFVEKVFPTVNRNLLPLVKLIINSSILPLIFHSFSFLSIAYLQQISYPYDMSKDSMAVYSFFRIASSLCIFHLSMSVD
jgi:hypothetical protein